MLHVKARDQTEAQAPSTSLDLIPGDCRGSVHRLLPTTQGNTTDHDAPLPAVIMVEGIDHPISASPLGHYYRYDTHAYAHEYKRMRLCAQGMSMRTDMLRLFGKKANYNDTHCSCGLAWCMLLIAALHNH